MWIGISMGKRLPYTKWGNGEGQCQSSEFRSSSELNEDQMLKSKNQTRKKMPADEKMTEPSSFFPIRW